MSRIYWYFSVPKHGQLLLTKQANVNHRSIIFIINIYICLLRYTGTMSKTFTVPPPPPLCSVIDASSPSLNQSRNSKKTLTISIEFHEDKYSYFSS